MKVACNAQKYSLATEGSTSSSKVAETSSSGSGGALQTR